MTDMPWFQSINEDDRIVTTHFPNGSLLHARAPREGEPDFEEAAARARALGYKAATWGLGLTYDEVIVWEMTKDHDRIHMELALAEGLPYSPTLYSVAIGFPVNPYVADLEERRVFYIQAQINKARYAR